jgi:hypothetical protein
MHRKSHTSNQRDREHHKNNPPESTNKTKQTLNLTQVRIVIKVEHTKEKSEGRKEIKEVVKNGLERHTSDHVDTFR